MIDQPIKFIFMIHIYKPMKYDLVTLDCFTANQNIKLKKNDNILTVLLERFHVEPKIIIKNVEFTKNSKYTIYINVKIASNVSLFIYFGNLYNKFSLVNGTNKININIIQHNIISIWLSIINPRAGMTFDILDMDIIDKFHDMDKNKVNQLLKRHFNNNVGFGKYRDIAKNLLKETIEIFDEFGIDYFLISGTLLGYVRHNDFIPWDDDIDLVVDASLIDKLPDIIKKYDKVKFVYFVSSKWIVKSCYEKRIILDGGVVNDWPYQHNWPFIDLFIFEYSDDRKHMSFFNKKWDVDKFYPIQKKLFLDMNVSVPSDPDYFLRINYGSDYMTILKSNSYCHKNERGINGSVNIHTKLLKYI